MNFSWFQLPPQILSPLLRGGVGTFHVFESANTVFQAVNTAPNPQEQRFLLALGQDMLLSVWENSLLESNTAATLVQVQESQPFIPPSLLGYIKFCARQAAQDAALKHIFDPEIARHQPQYSEILLQQARKNPSSFYIASHLVRYGMREFLLDWVQRFLERDARLPEPLTRGLLADVAFGKQDWDKAAQGYAAAHALLPLHIWQNRQAESLFRQDTQSAQDKALHLWRTSHLQRPWHVNTLLRLTDILQGRHKGGEGEFPPGHGAVLLYTWNKSKDIDETLAALAQTELQGPDGKAHIFILDNGSTDDTAAVLRKWQTALPEQMDIITLPINMGAPAARNYLLTLPEVKKADWATFLDDDIAMPHNWLRLFWAASKAYPQSGVVAAHAVDFDAPLSQQWTDMHIIPQLLDNNDWADKGERFSFSSLHEQALDFGDFNFMRPCVTGIGCCHFFTRQAMDEGGLFDVRFSPSQSDDVDHDMRRALKGHLPLYNGHLKILHKRNTGYHKGINRRGQGSALGNWFKLQVAYSPEEIMQIYQLDQQTMLEDVRQRLAVLEQR